MMRRELFTPLYAKKIIDLYGQDGADWLSSLPDKIAFAKDHWGFEYSLTLSLSFNFVVSGKQSGRQVILKISAPDPDAPFELNALKIMAKDPFAKVIALDVDQRMVLLEQVEPATQLSSLINDRERTRIFAKLLPRTRFEISNSARSEHLDMWRWFMNAKQKMDSFPAFPSYFDRATHLQVFNEISDLFASTAGERLIHGDLHHFNILRSGATWKVIDPKGVFGPIEYEVGPFLMNPVPRLVKYRSVECVLSDRIAILAERTGWRKSVIRDWAVSHAVLSAWWDARVGTTHGAYSDQVARLYASLDL